MEAKQTLREEQQVLQEWLQKLRSYPLSQEVRLDTYASGWITADEDGITWKWDKKDLVLKRTKYELEPGEIEPEVVEFNCKNHQFQLASTFYGMALWNTKSWVWTHPKCPFLLRYEWYENKQVFKQYIPTGRAMKPAMIAPSFTDWQLFEGGVQAVTVGQRNPPPEIPETAEWVVNGNVPPPVVLLVAMFTEIRLIVRKLFGLDVQQQQQVFEASGLNPIF